jgi:RNA polymerase sigma-70 factor (ECF subfamily)
MQDLAVRLARGEPSAFEELYDLCADRLHRYVAVRLGSVDAAADVVQTVFLRAVRSRRRFLSVEKPEAYMFRVARNETARAAARRSKRLENGMRRVELDRVADWNTDMGATVETAAELLGRMSAEDRELIELKVYSGLTFRELAELLNQPPGTVATRYRRAMLALRGFLKEETSRGA